MVAVNSSEVGSTMEREREREMEVDEEEEITVVVEGRDKVKGPWSLEEDTILSRLVSKFGARNWTLIARRIAGRSGKSCRLRWCNQLDPTVKRKPFTGLLHLHLQLHFHYFQNFGCFFLSVKLRVTHYFYSLAMSFSLWAIQIPLLYSC